MKIFKKAISLVLVFAMLAGFAGMTGFTPGIIAEARKIPAAGGAEITMWSTVYKINNANYDNNVNFTMTYPSADNYEKKLNSDNGDYAIPYFPDDNDLSYSIKFPANTTELAVYCSLDKKNWRGYDEVKPNSDNVWERSATTAMQDEYGVLYRDFLQGKGVQGFRDISVIYWKLEYVCNGTPYTQEWEVQVVDWDARNNGVNKIWDGAATSSKPTDSHAGKNELKNLHVPATLYLNGTSVIQSMNNRQGNSRRFDTYIMFTVPDGAYDIRLYQVNINDGGISDQLTFTKIGNSGNTHKWDVSGTIPSGTTEVYYRIQYKMDVTHVAGRNETVTYTQYAASYVKALQNHNAVWAGSFMMHRSWGKSWKNTFYHNIGFLPALVRNGVDVAVDVKYTKAFEEDTKERVDINGNWDLWGKASGTYAVGFRLSQQSTNGADIYKWAAGMCLNTNSTNTVGATIRYDAQATTVNSNDSYTLTNTGDSSIGIDSTLGPRQDKHDSWGDKWSIFDAYGERWQKGSTITYSVTDDRAATTSINSSGVYPDAYWSVSDSNHNLPAGTDNNGSATADYHAAYTLPTLKNIPTQLRWVSQYTGMNEQNHDLEVRIAYGWHMDIVSVTRTTPHALIETARTSNYVQAEMDATWWNNYRKSVFAAYVNCGNLQAAQATSFAADLSKPVYRFADYSALNTQILTGVDWDRGGKAKVDSEGKFVLGADGYPQAEANYLNWGAGYKKWNKTTYNTADGKVKVNGAYSLAAYDLVFEDDVLRIATDKEPRDGSYYYTTATWNAYKEARNEAAKIYNYPNSTAGWNYDSAYPAKVATDNGNSANIGLACYWQGYINHAASNIQAKRNALVKYDTKNGNYDIEQYYRRLLSEVGSMVYDGTGLLDFDTKHGLMSKKEDGTVVAVTSYDEETLQFRASHPDDVFDYVYPSDHEKDGWVICDEQGRPLAIDDKGTPDDTSDDEVVLASEIGDVGILAFPRGNEELRPVGVGNTFPQLYFDNSAASQYAVTSGRTALMNRLRWYYGGNSAGYEHLGMVEGVYNQNNLTEAQLCNNPKQYFWTGKEHQDDILREIYALLRVRKTLRLATNYRDVYQALNVKFGNMPAYDAEGTTYNSKQLDKITIFQTYAPASAWDTVSYTITNENNVTRTYNTTGKTWYTEESWAKFTAARDKLAGYIYNGSTGTVGNSSEIVAEYDYTSGIANKYYTYDAKLTSGDIITNKYFTNGQYTAGGSLAYEKQAEINKAVEDYYAAMEALELKDLDAYTWKPFDENISTVNSIKAQVQSMLTTATAKQDFYDFVPKTTDGKITDTDLDETNEIYVYNPSDVTLIEAYADAVLAAAASAEHPDTPYKGDDNLGDKAAAFDSALKTFKTQYDKMVKGATNYDTSSWDEIIDHLNELAGLTGTEDEITHGGIQGKFQLFYNDVQFVNAEGNTVSAYNEIGIAVANYDIALKAKPVKQADINAAVKKLYNALDNSTTSFEVGKAADAAIAYPQNYTFNVYNYTTENPDGSHLVKSQFTDGSVATLTTTATNAKNKTYPMLSTYVSDIATDKAAVEKLTGLASDNNGGVLVYNVAITDYLETAIAYAESQLYDVVDGQKVVKTIPVTSPAGETAQVEKFSEQSIAELEATLAEAQAVLDKVTDGTYGWDDQVEIDKYTYLVYDETLADADTTYLLGKNIVGMYGVPYIWNAVADGVVTKEDQWGTAATAYYTDVLYGTRGMTMKGMVEEGLKPGSAYYGFLDAEIKGNTIGEDTSYIGTVWYADGGLVYPEGSSTPAGDRVFKNWSSYMDAYNAAVALFKAQDKTIDKQSEIDAAANLLYEKRNGLELLSLYFPNNTEDYKTAQGWYDELAAYVQKTDVTRYGWEYVDVTEEVTDETTDEVTTVTTTVFQKSENPLSSVEQSVYIYNGITPEIEADIAKFKAKYASDSSTEDYNSLEAAQALYNSINAALTDPATGKLYTVKKTNDESLIAGMLDLTGRVDPETEEIVGGYIAGKWTVTFDDETGASTGVYATDLLNDTQAGLLQTYLTNAQNRINAKTDATAGFGGQLAGFTTTIFEEVQKPATDLQFANAMRKQVEGFMDMKFNIELPSFYNGGNTITAPVFDQKMVAEYKNDIKTFYEQTYEWPAIYQIHGLEVVKATGSNYSAITDNYMVIKYPSGQETGALDSAIRNQNAVNPAFAKLEPQNEDEESVDRRIYKLFTELGGKSHYYTEIFDYVNSYHTASLAWIVNNALGKKLFIDDVETEVILADLNSTANGNDGSKITVEDAQLTAIINSNVPFGQQETVMIDVNYDVRKITSTESWYTEGYGETDNGRVYYNYVWFKDTKTLGNTLTKAQTQINTLLKITDFNEPTQLIVYAGAKTHADYIEDYCWTSTREDNLSATITTGQRNIKTHAQNIYKAILDLELLPAIDAYRDVYNTYLGVMGQHIDDLNWLEGSFSHAILDGENKELISDVDFKFYNVGQVSKLPDNIEYNIPDGVVPPYGTVSRSQYGSFLTQYTTTEEYADKTNNPWYNLVYSIPGTEYHNPDSFINKFISTQEADMITIDQAAKVNSYNVGTADDDKYKSIMEELIDDYLSKLEFDDLVFDKLDAVVAAFLGDKLPEVLGDGEGSISGALRQEGFTVGEKYGGKFYPLSYYTDESLLQVAGILRSNHVLKDGVIIEKIINEDGYKWIGETFPLPIAYDYNLWGSFYTSVTDQNKIDSSNPDDNSMLLGFLNALNKQLILRPVKIAKENVNERDYLTEALSAAAFAEANKAKYDTNHTSWNTFETEYKNAQALLDNVDNYNITHQELFDNQTSALLKAIENLKNALIADNYAPSMTLKTSVGGVKDFYSKAAYAVQLNEADPESYKGAGEKLEEKANPAAGTFFVPNSSGYSLIVYTNELNPRIVINLEDLEQKLADGTNGGAAVMQDAAKKEFISINAVRTSGVETNVIAGTIVPEQKENLETMSVLETAQATSNSAVTVENASTVKGSSAFAILAPKFVKDTATQAALYTIEARDGSVRSTETGTVNGNNADKFEFGGAGQEPVDIVKDNNGKIAIYIYYYSLKAKDGTDEGINADGSALATPAINGTHVPSALLSGEPGFKGADWRNGILLQRHFSDSHRVWEYVSEVKKNENNQYSVNGTIGVPVYNDPNFGYLNTGSFYYVLDKNAGAETVDGKVIAEYNSGNNSVAGCMDYDRATAAKTAMIDAINAMTETEFAVMKKSGRFYNYGDYETDEFGNVLYNGDEPKWINWAQSLNNKVENGDLVFVHVVDRWGNVVNRIVEITNLDENAPKVSSDAAGAVAITEKGGSGITDIQVHNGDFSLGEFEYQVSQSQNVKLENGQIANKAEVNCASNVLTIVNLVPGKTYYIGAEDNAGNRGTTAVKADANGHIVITINNEIVQTGEDMSIEGNSSIFTLNGTDTIILNSGEASSVIDATMKGNVFANYIIRHYITTKDNVTALKTVNQDGTVEEWTADNATVKDNGDGTFKWTIKRKLAEGEHSYKVYAKVNGEYENFYVPATITATTRTVKLTYTVVGMGKTVMEHSGAASAKNSTYKSTTVPYGSYVTITADTNVEGCEFYYWINNTTDRIISTANVYEFKAVTDIDCVAQFTNGSTYYDGKKLVVYVNNAKNVIERFELADGDNYTVPTGPVLPDYTFKGWSMTKAEVLASEKDTVIVEPIYELNASNTVTITEGNYTATGAGTYKAEDNQRAVVTISTSAKDGDGKEFLYWIDADTDEIVSYDRTYTFFCVKDTELTPVYGDASTVKAVPIARITEVKFNALSGKVSFFAERSVPEEYMILQTGIVVTKTESIGTNEDVFVVGGASTAAGTSTSTANNGYYSANTAVATGQTVWARAYVIYETADGEIFEAYGPVVSYTVD